MKKISLLILLCVLSSTSFAHEIWFAQRSGELALVYGHGSEDLSMVKRAKLITGVDGFTATGAPAATSLKLTDHLALLDVANSPAYITATMDNGYWSKNSDGKWFNKGVDEVPNAIVSGRYLKFATNLRILPAGLSLQLPNLAFQIVVTSAQFPKHKGDPLSIAVLLDGKPVRGAQVWVDAVNEPDTKPLMTDKNGRATFKVRNQGLNVIKAEFGAPYPDPVKTKLTQYNATLSFALLHKPE